MSIAAARAIQNRVPVDPHNVARCVRAIKLVALASIITSPFWLEALLFTTPIDNSSLIGIVLLAIVAGIAILHFSQTERYLRRLMMTALVAHMVAASLFLWVAIAIYGGADDAFGYWNIGLQKASDFHIYGWSVFKPPYWSTNLIFNLCGLAVLLVGGDLPVLFLVFAFVPLAAGYLYYRAFTVAFPDSNRWLFGLLAFLSPSVLFWSSFIGKDSLIQYFIALTCFGFAKFTQNHSFRAALVSAAGLTGILLIRAHVAAIFAIAMAVPYVVGSRAGDLRKAARKVILVPVLFGATYILLTQARTFLQSNTTGGNETTTAFQEADLVARNSQFGGSAFNQGTPLVVRAAESPFLMFRPFPWEIHNWLALLSAVEALGWMILCYVRRREIWWVLQHWRDPYVGFLLIYVIIFSITFGATISNFGLLARERIMMMPLVFMLICAKPKRLTQSSSERLKKGARVTLLNRRVAV